MDQWVAIIQEIGFPVVVSFYLLHRIESRLEAIRDALVAITPVTKV
ncbi:YvrJ family protein [Tetzosporium hominis]|uniref:YvrJ family protein n=2 Tax=Caryophanaceae TaxID=186818 RepID=A0A264W586_9BACL|nr:MULTISPECIES: YvrJ family protein [Planococcaceae]OZS78753.1 YvrJ family protein [Tetzosporium hominis]PJK17653.1 YvrJ family protein [Chryseomicrobium excrementi]